MILFIFVAVLTLPVLSQIDPLLPAFDRLDIYTVKEDDRLICYVNDVVNRVEQLDGCTAIIGSLVIEKGAPHKPTTNTLKYLQGCLEIIGTNLRSIELIYDVTGIECEEPQGNRIFNNEFLCIMPEQEKYLKNKEISMDIKYHECPLCVTYGEECQTLISDVNFVENTTIRADLKRLVLLVGHLTCEDYKGARLSRAKKLSVRCDTCEDEPAVMITNCSAPERSFFHHLYIDPKRSPNAMSVQIVAYLMPRATYAMLTDRYSAKVLAEVEADGDCVLHENEKENPFLDEDLLYCEKLQGKIRFNSTGMDYLRPHWKHIISTHEKAEFIGGSELMHIFAKTVDVYFYPPMFRLQITFTERLCLDINVVRLARKWMTEGKRDKSDQNRVLYDNHPRCEHYIGHLTDYDLRADNGKKIIHITGALELKALYIPSIFQKIVRQEKIRGNETSTFDKNINRFTKLKKIEKNLVIPKEIPALSIGMCLHVVVIPEWVFNINISSERGDDYLISVQGPGYKMNKVEYNRFLAKYPPHRLDIDPMGAKDCHFIIPVGKLSELDDCEVIIGDLILDQDTDGETTTVIKQVTGCIRIANTYLENLDFLKFDIPYNPQACFDCRTQGVGVFEIRNNPDLCFNPQGVFEKELHKYIHDNNNNCSHIVPEKSYMIFNVDNNSSLNHLDKITEIKGRIVVSGNNAEHLDIFPNLQKITYHGQGPAIIIENNPNLVSFKLPKLRKLIVTDKTHAVVIKNNPNLNLTSDELQSSFKTASRNASIILDDKLDAEEKVEEEVEEKEEERGMGLGAALAIGFGGSVALILVAALITVVAVVVLTVLNRRRAKKKTIIVVKETQSKSTTTTK